MQLFIEDILPNHMMPSIFVKLHAFPLDIRGKIDHQALPDPRNLRPAPGNYYVPTCNPVEDKLVALVVQVLGLTEINITDDILDLGGDSLLVTQIISRVGKIFRVNLSPRSIFQSSSISNLALVITQKMFEQQEREGVYRLLTELEEPVR